MSQSTHQIAIKGIDQTAGAFNSVGARAKATGASIRAAVGGALAAAGAYLSLRAVVDSVQTLGAMSDAAMKAGTSVEFLTKSVTAFQVAGLNVSQESLVKAMQFMQKNTGKQGEGAFFEITKQIAAIPDAAERAKAAVQTFGRSGMELMPLVNNGQEAIEKFRTLIDIMPGVSTAAADAGDAAADALTIFGKGAQSIMLKAVGKICALWGEEFPGGVRAGALNAINWLETFFKKAWAWMEKWANYIGAFAGFVTNAFDVGIGDAWDIFTDQLDDVANEYEARIDRINAKREDYKANLAKLDVDDLANVFGNKHNAEAAGDALGAAAAKRISNQLMLAGSNDARKLQIMGPQYQNEQKKQTGLLEKIAKNTEKTADNTEGGETYPSTDL